jgi:hypothetical protein
MSNGDEAAFLARRKAEDLLNRNKVRDDERVTGVLKQREREAAKTARLRELRLAKETAELEAKKTTSRRSRRAPRSG